jgi:MFS family permease
VLGNDTLTIGAYILYNLVFAIASYPLGILADRIGIRTVFLGGLLVFALVYFLFSLATSALLIFAGFFIYGLYAAATEGISKAWITNMAHTTNTGTALGFYTSCESICTLLASVIAGWLWGSFGSSVTFLCTAVSALLVFNYYFFFLRAARQTSV